MSAHAPGAGTSDAARDEMTPPNTPGLLGYLVGVCASDLVCAPLLLLIAMATAGEPPDPSGVLAAVLYTPFVCVEVAVVGLPVALVGVVLVEVLCRRVRSQVAHAVVAAIAGLVLSLAYLQLTGLGTDWLLPDAVALAVALSAGVGRAAVIPVVALRRRRFAAGRPGRVT